MIALKFYRTHGYGCEHMRFVRVAPNKYQRVSKFLCFYFPIGSVIRESDINYFKA